MIIDVTRQYLSIIGFWMTVEISWCLWILKLMVAFQNQCLSVTRVYIRQIGWYHTPKNMVKWIVLVSALTHSFLNIWTFETVNSNTNICLLMHAFSGCKDLLLILLLLAGILLNDVKKTCVQEQVMGSSYWGGSM